MSGYVVEVDGHEIIINDWITVDGKKAVHLGFTATVLTVTQRGIVLNGIFYDIDDLLRIIRADEEDEEDVED
jgi:hypothetical protein